jgi:hypothetical protein
MNLELFLEILAWVAVSLCMTLHFLAMSYNKTVILSYQQITPKGHFDVAGLVGAIWLLSVYLK